MHWTHATNDGRCHQLGSLSERCSIVDSEYDYDCDKGMATVQRRLGESILTTTAVLDVTLPGSPAAK
jgi:hypothetical protein